MKKRKGNRINYLKQKLPSALSHHDIIFIAMANYFVYFTSFPVFETFRSNTFMHKIHVVAVENEIITLIDPHVKKHDNAE